VREIKKSSPAEDFVDLIAMLPWWAGTLAAVVSYLLLSALAHRPLPDAQAAAEMGQMASATLWRGLAQGGQFLVPFLCVLGAVVSGYRKFKRRSLLQSVTKSPTANAMQGLSWREFELLVGEGFRRQGYAVVETGGGGPDGGVDLVLCKNGEKFLVQCKQWRAFKVGVSVVRELYGLMAAQGAAGGIVVTSGRFTDEAAEFAGGRNIRLINGSGFLDLIQHGQNIRTARQQPHMSGQSSAANAMPSCPVCSQSMVKRVAKRGHSAGSAFWGCSTYPQCKGTRPV